MNFPAVDVGREYEVSVAAVSAAGFSEVATIIRNTEYHPSPSYPGERCRIEDFECSGKKKLNWRIVGSVSVDVRFFHHVWLTGVAKLQVKPYLLKKIQQREKYIWTQIRKRHFSYSRTLFFFRNWSILRHRTLLY